jgi:diguanylate cyclase (GGDEF)-like protein/putative nucleotidyltransferase with HDIG domain
MPPSAFISLSTKAKVYVVLVICSGLLTIGHSLYALTRQQIGWSWTVLAVLTLVSGSATVKLPSLPATISVSETFVFTSVLLFGPAAGTLTVALDALVISLWGHRRKRQPPYKSLFNVSALALTLWASAHIFFISSNTEPLVLNRDQVFQLSKIVFPLLAFTIAYFVLNSGIIAFAISLERHLSPFRIWRDNFAWLSLNYFGGASVAALLVTYTKDLDFTYFGDFAYIALIIPLLLVLYFTFSMSMGRVEDANRHLAQLNSLYMSTIETLAMAIDAKDQITHGHIRRVQIYAVGLAQKIGVTDPQLIQAIEAAALLHDMGKLAVPEYILNKPGRLTPAEFEKMKLHASVGADILSAIDFPYPVVPIVRHHHENWNGAGYPDGIAGTDIPIGARILAVVDCFDALTSDRPYRPRLPDKDAIDILLERRGTMYDPLVVDTFIKIYQEIAPPTTAELEPAPLRAITDAAAPTTLRQTSAHGFDDISGSTEEMLTLFSLARGLNSLNSVQDVGDIISKHLRRLIPSSLSVLYSYDAEADELVAVHSAGENAGLVAGMRIGTGQRLSGWVAANRRTIRNSDPVLDFGETARAMSPRPRSCLSTPLVASGNLIGVLTLYSTTREAFSEEHQRVIEVVARQVTPAVQQSAELQRTKVKLLHDTVTGLPKLEHFRDIASTQVSEATTHRPVSVIVVSFGTFRDAKEGQRKALSTDNVARLVHLTRQSLRAADMLFQYGASRFVALLLHTDRGTGLAIAGRITDAISRAENRDDDSFEGAGDTHVSVASAPDDGASIEDLLRVCLATRPIEADLSDRPGGRPPSIH